MIHKEIATREARPPAAWDPLRDFKALTGMTEIFDDFFGGSPPLRLPLAGRELLPKVNIQETDKEYVITAAVPGVKKEDVKIKVQDGVLTVSGERREEKEEKVRSWLRHEVAYGSFQRSFVLPAGTHSEDVKAVYKEGMLTVSMPKPAQDKRRELNIKVE
jgi:HSP20 family protein